MRLLWTSTAAVFSFGVGVFALYRIELKWAAIIPIAAIFGMLSGALLWVLLGAQTAKMGKARPWLLAAGIANLVAGGFQAAAGFEGSTAISIGMVLVGFLLIGYALSGGKQSSKLDRTEVTAGSGKEVAPR